MFIFNRKSQKLAKRQQRWPGNLNQVFTNTAEGGLYYKLSVLSTPNKLAQCFSTVSWAQSTSGLLTALPWPGGMRLSRPECDLSIGGENRRGRGRGMVEVMHQVRKRATATAGPPGADLVT